ncbi:type II secretion system protein GspD [Syntrophotalea acetylenivorans]|uniref:Type II secretion system protein GspD n=1 Tax=Syntrophotalea acetylenivorans TaxID=1842532 RepID=A0A1L3GPN4_9BACT|nr:type II secretion system secretin GspD [Syntrophotalea acetylenivorans]APG27911.1 type II secretion system protein GspD [Syntrophotalea acetylenivorans]
MLLSSLRPKADRTRLLHTLLPLLAAMLVSLVILQPLAACAEELSAEALPATEGPAATLVEEARVNPTGATLITDGQIVKYRYFALPSPPRLVVDIYDVEPAFTEREFAMQGAFSQMRVGIYPDKTRFVFDAPHAVPEHTVVSTGEALEILWSTVDGSAKEDLAIDNAAKTDPFALPAEATVNGPAAAVRSSAVTTKPTEGSDVSLDFTDIELADLIKTISELTGRNFVYDDTVKGKVTVITPEGMSRAEAYQLFLTVLSVKGFTVIPSGKVHKIIRDKDAKETNLPLLADGRQTSGEQFVTRLVRLQHIDAETMANSVLAPLIPKTGNIVSYPPANTLIITDSAANIERLVKIIRRLDVPSSVDRLEVISLEFANAEEVAEICQTVLSQTGPKASSGKNGKSAQQGATSQVLPYPRTNSLLVMASEEDLQTVRQLVNRLDQKPTEDRSPINVYYLENADAEKLAETLTHIVAGKKGVVRNGRSQSGSTSLSEDLSITADKPTNALIINGSPEDYEQVREIIAQLDIKRKQVYVETLILELSMDATKQLGASLQGAFKVGDGVVNISTNQGLGPASLSDFTASDDSTLPSVLGQAIDGILLGGLFSPISVEGADGNVITIPAFSALIDLSKTNNDVNILSAPRLLTSDNEEAEIIVGANVPIITERLTDTGGSDSLAQSVSVERQDVALTLRFTPQITEGDLVRLNVFQEITGIAQNQIGDVDSIGPTLTKRLLRNTVLAEDGQTVVLGGLIRNDVQDIESKVPLLGDIPVLGWLFKHSTKIESKVNLLIFITPRIIKDKDDLAAVTRRSSRAMEAFRPEGAPPLIPAELLGNDLLYAPIESNDSSASTR